ncbi:MAG TPA: hypothetical protein VK427_04645 [Kofleriaceae bacterium]|nr:hypothetical protein [Kofleriaceae bacterium]
MVKNKKATKPTNQAAAKPTPSAPTANPTAAPNAAARVATAAGTLPGVQFPGELEIATQEGSTVEDLPLAQALAAGTLVAARLVGAEVRQHLYIVHKSRPGNSVTVLAYANGAALGVAAGAAVRLPQAGAWLSCPADGMVFIVASARALDRAQIIELIGGRAPPPTKGDDDNIVRSAPFGGAPEK